MMAYSCSLAAHREQVVEERLAAYSDELAEQYATERGLPLHPFAMQNEIDERGRFLRQANYFTTPFGSKAGEHKAEAGRYAIYWQHGCNWSNRPIIARDILGLQDVIKDQLISKGGQTNRYGYGFGAYPDYQDPLTGVYFLAEFYKNADPGFHGRATTPTMVDIIDKKAVNNDYHRMTNYIEVQFRRFQPVDAPDLYPVQYRREIDQLNDWLYAHVNNGHYRMAFCKSPYAYWTSYQDFYESLERLDKRLETNRFLFGDYITDSDIRLYTTLIRWDMGYYQNIGPVWKPIFGYKNLWGYLRELYQEPSFHKTQFVKELASTHHAVADKNHATNWTNRIASRMVDDTEGCSIDDILGLGGAEAPIPFLQTGVPRESLSNHPDEIYLRHPEGETAEDYQSEISWCHWNSADPAERLDDDPANSPLDVDASINPLKGQIDR